MPGTGAKVVIARPRVDAVICGQGEDRFIACPDQIRAAAKAGVTMSLLLVPQILASGCQ